MPAAPRVALSREGAALRVDVGGRWTLGALTPAVAAVAREMEPDPPARLAFSTSDLSAWDSSLVAFVHASAGLARAGTQAPAALPGMTVTSFTDAPAPPSRRPGISSRSPAAIGIRERIGDRSRPVATSRYAASIASSSSGMGAAALSWPASTMRMGGCYPAGRCQTGRAKAIQPMAAIAERLTIVQVVAAGENRSARNPATRRERVIVSVTRP